MKKEIKEFKQSWIPSEKYENGYYYAKVEQIGTGKKDTLYICNRKPNLWIGSLFNGYAQIGIFPDVEHRKYEEGEPIVVELKDGLIKKVFKVKIIEKVLWK